MRFIPKLVQFSPKSGFRLTRLLVLLSIAGSGLSILLSGTGFGEVYPFATWKLYTQPLGNKQVYEEYRLYTLTPGDSAFRRLSVQATDAFTADEYVYTLHALTQAALGQGAASGKAKARLLQFARHVAPAATQYQVVQERYHPKHHAAAPQAYDTRTVIRF
ncbi:hypothetical protein ACXYMU_10215 [Pontibacter sp. CAU 1760]